MFGYYLLLTCGQSVWRYEVCYFLFTWSLQVPRFISFDRCDVESQRGSPNMRLTCACPQVMRGGDQYSPPWHQQRAESIPLLLSSPLLPGVSCSYLHVKVRGEQHPDESQTRLSVCLSLVLGCLVEIADDDKILKSSRPASVGTHKMVTRWNMPSGFYHRRERTRDRSFCRKMIFFFMTSCLISDRWHCCRQCSYMRHLMSCHIPAEAHFCSVCVCVCVR